MTLMTKPQFVQCLLGSLDVRLWIEPPKDKQSLFQPLSLLFWPFPMPVHHATLA